MFDILRQDVRYGVRALRRTPGFTLAALLTLGLGIGGTTAIFSVVEAVVRRPLGYRDPDRLFAIHEVMTASTGATRRTPVSAVHFQEWRTATHSFEEMALIYPVSFTLTGIGEPQPVAAARTSPALFPMLGIRALYGRTFSEDEDHPGRDRVVVLGHDLWNRQFGADPSIVGRTITLDGEPYTVIGVLPKGAEFPRLSHLYAMTVAAERPQLWKPLAARNQELGVGAFNFACIARLNRNVSAPQAISELSAVQKDLARRMSGIVELQAVLVPLKEQITGRSSVGLHLLLATVAMVLLVGCINIANLLLTRGLGRRREFAIRQATGASHGRIVCQLMIESLLLAFVGGLLGAALAEGAIRLIIASAPVDLPRLDEVALEPRVLLFTAAISIGSGVLIGLLPAWWLSRIEPLDALKSVSKSLTPGRASLRVRSLLVGLEVGASTSCLIVAWLLVSSFANVLRVQRGFETEHIVTTDLKLPATRYNNVEAARFLKALAEAARALPGVMSVGISDRLPLSGEGGNSALMVEGTTLPRFQRPIASLQLADAGYFRTLGIPLLSGRLFDEADRHRTPVAIVAASAAERVWPSQNAMGRRFRIGPDDSPLIEVIGVIGDVRGVSLDSSARLNVYLPYWQVFVGQASLSVRTASDPAGVVPAVRAAVRRLDPELAVPAFRTMDQVVAESVAPRRFQMSLVLLFAVTALLLSSIGIYGTTSHAVTQRTNEIGIRMALGAHPGRIQWMVLVQGLTPVAVGIGGGFAFSLALGAVLRNLLFGVSPADLTTFAAAGLFLAAVALLANYLPARRATRVNPVTALRSE